MSLHAVGNAVDREVSTACLWTCLAYASGGILYVPLERLFSEGGWPIADETGIYFAYLRFGGIPGAAILRAGGARCGRPGWDGSG